jgi:cobyrinic acid a,c-diamide synthase
VVSFTSKATRLVIAGMAGDSGKSIVSLALLRALRGLVPANASMPAARNGGVVEVRAFKKGPDYIDAAWLSFVSGAPARNLDSWLMGFEGVVESFAANASRDGFNLVEGNRGLFDGVDAAGTHSTAELAKALAAPVLLVVNVTKMTRTAAALVVGCRQLDPGLRIAGVVLNCVASKRHEKVVRESIEQACGIPVVGAIPKLRSEALPQRHLGLVTPEDHPSVSQLPAALDEIAAHLDLARIKEIAADVDALPAVDVPPAVAAGPAVRVAVVRDAAFSFYYEDNLEALRQSGGELVYVSALRDSALPREVNAVYIGGGFPEVHAAALEANAAFRESLAGAAAAGLPIYAECGGLMLLSRALRWKDKRFSMAGVLPFEVEVDAAPQGHGYVEMTVDASNPFYPVGTVLRGHEFHYSRAALASEPARTACQMRRGTGLWTKRDAAVVHNVWASYTHLHARGTPEWAPAVIRASGMVELAG